MNEGQFNIVNYNCIPTKTHRGLGNGALYFKLHTSGFFFTARLPLEADISRARGHTLPCNTDNRVRIDLLC